MTYEEIQEKWHRKMFSSATVRDKYPELLKTPYTFGQWYNLCASHNHRCVLCGIEAPLSRDHIIPICSGGRDVLENLQPLCYYCNSSRKEGLSINFAPLSEAAKRTFIEYCDNEKLVAQKRRNKKKHTNYKRNVRLRREVENAQHLQETIVG